MADKVYVLNVYVPFPLTRFTVKNSGMARVRLADLNGPKWPLQAKMDHFGPFLVSRMLKSSSEIRPF